MTMTHTLTLFTHPMSRGRIARWMVEETQAPYEAKLVEYGPAMKTAEYRSMNPMGKVPTIVYGEQVVTECAAICAFLADAFPQAGLAPPLAERGAYYRWLFFAAGPVEAAILNQSLGFAVPDDKRGRAGYGNFEQMVDGLEAAVSGKPFVASDKFTAADVYVGSQIMWGTRFGTLPSRPAFLEYAGALAQRPAYKRAAELDDALAESMKASSTARAE